MNAVVLQAALVCLAIASSANGKISSSAMQNLDVNDFHSISKNKIEQPHEETLKEKCRKNSPKANAFEAIQKHMQTYYFCLESKNITVALKKLNGHKPENDNAALIKGLCKKVPDWHSCGQNLTIALKECLDESEKSFITISNNVSVAIETFACENDGDRISTFYSNDGVKCLSDKSQALKQCTETLAKKKYMPKSTGSSFEKFLTHFKFNEEQCSDLRELKSCLVDELRQCDQPTTANLTETMFELALRSTPCAKFMKA